MARRKAPEDVLELARDLTDQPRQYDFRRILRGLRRIRRYQPETGRTRFETAEFDITDEYVTRKCEIKIGWRDDPAFDVREKLGYGSRLTVSRLTPHQDIGLDLEEIARFETKGAPAGLLILKPGITVALEEQVFEHYKATIIVPGEAKGQGVICQKQYAFSKSNETSVGAWAYEGMNAITSFPREGTCQVDTRPVSETRGYVLVANQRDGYVFINNNGPRPSKLRFEKLKKDKD